MNTLLERRRGMMQVVGGGGSPLVVYPSGYKDLDGTISDPSNAYEPADSTTYAYVNGKECKFTFDTSSLPSDATITSASLVVKARNSGSGRWMRVYSGNTQKEGVTMDTSIQTRTFDLSSWTLAELLDCSFGLSHNVAGALYIYGATLTIEYE